MRDPQFSKYERFIDILISKGYITEDDENALWQKTSDLSLSECKAYLAARLAEKKRIDEANAREEAEYKARQEAAASTNKHG